MTKSIFSKIIDREIESNIIAENNHIIVIEDILPKAPIHFLIIPKKNIKDVQSFSDNDFVYAAEMFKMAKKLSEEIPGAKDFRLQVNSGVDAGQEIFHVHMHFLAGKIFSK